MRISIRFGDINVELTELDQNLTIVETKKILCSVLNTKFVGTLEAVPSRISLYFGDVFLENHRSLNSYHISENSSLLHAYYK